MKTNAYSILDVKLDTFGVPFFFPTNGAALRAFSDLANDPQTTVGRHPEDFKLVHIGTFDDSSAALVASEDNVSLGFAAEYVKKSGD